MDRAVQLAHVVIPGLPKLTNTALAPSSFERTRWAERLNRAVNRTGRPCKIGYSHGSAGHYDADGCFRVFGGPMIFSAWCACGQFRYDGVDEQGRRAAVKAHKAWVALGINDVVTYYGPVAAQHGREFVITAVDGHQLSLEDVEWGNIHLTGVDRAAIESAGRSWRPITCGHPRYTRHSMDGRCMTYGCNEGHLDQ